MSNPGEFSVSTARPLPVVLMADVSGSMAADGKIAALNTAVTEMIAAFAEEDDSRAAIHVAVVTFGGSATLHQPLQPATQVRWSPMQASGQTPLGAALDLVTGLIEDREILSSRAYKPAIVLASDGQPTDEWRAPLSRLLASERGKKAQRFALAIGADADRAMLKEFLADPEARVFEASEAREIRKFFRWVTMTVASRSRAARPDMSVNIAPADIDDYGEF